jgi:RNA polymerase sigma-70 factor (ECF subfamily)
MRPAGDDPVDPPPPATAVQVLDRPAFRQLFQSQRERIFRLLFRLTGDAAQAEDLLQDTFLAVWRKRAQFEGRGAPEGYLRRTAVRLFLNHRETRSRRAARPPESAVEREVRAPDECVERAESLAFLAERVREALERLPEAARQTFVLHRYEGWTCAEIAAATGIPVKTVETRLRRATLLLAERLSAYRDLVPAP